MLGPSRPRLPCNACHCQAALRYHPLSCKPVTRPSCTACRCAGPQVLVTSPPASNGSPPVCACLNLPRPPQRFCFPCRHGAASPTTRDQPLQLVHAMFCSSWSFPRILPCVAIRCNSCFGCRQCAAVQHASTWLRFPADGNWQRACWPGAQTGTARGARRRSQSWRRSQGKCSLSRPPVSCPRGCLRKIASTVHLTVHLIQAPSISP